MKKIAILLLLAATLLNTAACKGGDDVTTADEKKPEVTDTAKVTDESTDAVTDEQTDAETNTVTDEVTDEVTDAVTEEEKELTLGNIDGNTYKSDFIDIGCTLGDGWVFYNDEQIAQINGITQSYLDKEYLEQVKNAKVFYDMYAVNQETSSTINITLEKGTKLAVLLTDIDKVLTNSTVSIESSFANMGGKNFKYELCDVKIGDETFKGMDIYVEINDVPIYETMLCIKCGEYLAYVCVGTYFEDTTGDILETFFIVD
ncbi:MAG: hypothetical protein IKL21_00505 [Clostridia bacterium]|nr:hypothetical protein [Clostridia bacterium]